MMYYGTLSKYGEKQGLEVTILSGDRDTFQLATDKVTIRIPHTKAGKTETDEFNKEKIIEKYGIEPKQLIDVKGLQGDSSDNIPGVPGVGEKTALTLIKKFGSIEKLYEAIEKNEDGLKGKQREKIVDNKELAFMSKTLGTINLEVPIADTLENFKVEEWDKERVLEIFKELNFKRYIERFSLTDSETNKDIDKKTLFKINDKNTEEIIKLIKEQKELIFYISTEEDKNENKIIKEKITGISVYNNKENESYYLDLDEKQVLEFKEILENKEIKKVSTDLTKIYILLRQVGIEIKGIDYDISIATYILNPTNNKLKIENLIEQYLEIDVSKYINKEENQQINLFESIEKDNSKQEKEKYMLYAYAISEIRKMTLRKLKETNSLELFTNIDMPTIEVLSDMQWNGIYLDEDELNEFGKELTKKIETITKIIYEMAGEEFNINSPKQLGEILFEKMKLPVIKKTKSGYSTDVDVLEKLKKEHPVIEKILEYRTLMKLNSTYVEGLLPYVNTKTKRIHSYFHQTITATGRISSTEPNLQNIPTRIELGKQLRKAFKPEKGYIYIDADYSQIELRVLAHISQDENMINAFENDEDIHRQVASKVFDVPMEEVTKEQRSAAKAVNFGIVYGISDFGLAEQLGIGRKKAKQYIEQYKEKYMGIKNFMDNIVEEAKKRGYVETLFHRRREIPELSSNNYMVRQFGARVAMNTPIQGTAADIMKIAMIKLFDRIEKEKLSAKLILQVHDELIVECKKEESEQVKQVLKESMENATKLSIPLKVEISEANNWYEAK